MTINPVDDFDSSEEDENEGEGLARTDRPQKSTGSAEPIPGRCGAKLRNTNPAVYCQKWPVQGRERCRFHGGLTPRGMASPHYRGRGYTKDIPARLFERLLEGLDDPELTSMRTELALIDARMGELLGTLSERGHTELLAAIRSSCSRLRYLSDRPDLQDRERTIADAIDTLESHLDEMAAERGAWTEVYGLIDKRRRTANVELRREEFLEHTMQHQQATWFMQQLLTAIHEVIPDPEMKQTLALRVAALLNREPKQLHSGA